MRNPLFVAEHRGGSLKMDDHKRLIHWARECAEHILPLIDRQIDPRLYDALQVAKDWEEGRVKTGVAMRASLRAHTTARESSNPVSTAVARAVGQAVASAHMADHSLGAALYALKALKLAGKSWDEERAWQQKRLAPLSKELEELVLKTLSDKGKHFNL